MNYYVISNPNDPIGVIFHDYAKGSFLIYTISKALQKSVDNLLKVVLGDQFFKVNEDTVKAINVSFGSMTLSDFLLKKLCKGPWRLHSEGVLQPTENPLDFSKTILPY